MDNCFTFITQERDEWYFVPVLNLPDNFHRNDKKENSLKCLYSEIEKAKKSLGMAVTPLERQLILNSLKRKQDIFFNTTNYLT